jgi:hypothetical protein
MKTFLPFFLIIFHLAATAQITTPVVRAGFGIEAELRANFFNNFVQSGNDDWFNNGTAGTGTFVIDTNGAASLMATWAVNPAARRLPFYRTMRVPQFSLINNRLWIDAVYIRDYNGQAGGDSTAFVVSNKNGDSPGSWSGGATSVLDKNDIGEMMVHVRRAGPSKFDTLWFMGGISLQGTSGNRYFDFELYQTDIFYSRATGQFTNYGPDEGHTSWKFDAGGYIITPGDVIFTAEFSSSSLSLLEARIWVKRSDLTDVVPIGFSWTGTFDGAGPSSTYGYAGIQPSVYGPYYVGMQSANATWAGPFGFIDGGNNLLTTYTARQFMEFGVNLTKLGLDPITLLGGDACGLPFRRILVKTRSSTSFTSELKDFIGPFDFFITPPVQAMADVPMYCGVTSVSELFVTNPSSASVYTWKTPNGNIVSDTVGTSIQVNQPGTYIVTQQLLDGCSKHATDTVVITFDPYCVPMDNKVFQFKGAINKSLSTLSWSSNANNLTDYYELQRSTDGINFVPVTKLLSDPSAPYFKEFNVEDDISGITQNNVFYRIKIRMSAGNISYTNTIKMVIDRDELSVSVYPNPVGNIMQLLIPSDNMYEARISLFNASGAMVKTTPFSLKEGINQFQMDVSWLQPGVYMINIARNKQNVWKKFVVSRNLVNN